MSYNRPLAFKNIVLVFYIVFKINYHNRRYLRKHISVKLRLCIFDIKTKNST